MTEDHRPLGDPPRRSFLAALGALVVGGLATLAPLVPGVMVLLDPLRRRGGERGMVRVARLSLLPRDGSPRRFDVRADRNDAWTTYTDVPVGAVYVRRTGPAEVEALNVICPHAGCFVGLAENGPGFACPCHDSRFAADGSIADPASPSPRPMDALEVEIRDGDEVWVRFQNFQTGQSRKLPIA